MVTFHLDSHTPDPSIPLLLKSLGVEFIGDILASSGEFE